MCAATVLPRRPQRAMFSQPRRSPVAMDQDKDKDEVSMSPAGESVQGPALRQLMFGVIANLVALSPGMSLGFSAVALPQMMKFDGIDEHQASWIASLAAISTPFGCILSGPILDRLGRRVAMLAVNAPCLLGWLLLAAAPRHSGATTLIYLGRVLTGLGAGLACTPATVYLGESAQQSLRGVLVTWTSIAFSLGILAVYVLGALFQEHWRLVAGLSAAVPLLAGLCVLLLPESPVWLARQGRPAAAEASLRRLRGVAASADTPAHLRRELASLAVQAARRTVARDLGHLRRRECLAPLLIMNLFFFFQQASGVFVVIFYAVDVVQEAGVEIDKYLVTVLIGLTRLVVTIFISYASKSFGRRPCAIVSGSGMTLSMGSLATYLFCVNNKLLSDETIDKINWYPVLALIVYISMSTVGFLTLPFAMIGEVYPAQVRGLASGVTTCFGYVCSFIIVKLYPDMLEMLGRHGLFLFYSVMSLAGTFFVFLYLPETRGKSLSDIEEYFSNNGSKIKNVLRQENHVSQNQAGEMTILVNEDQFSTKLIVPDVDKYEH
ncbi:facilitated trehalose transporter Tret1-2 homolog [Bacillus rossius redtenbacheri]|uniref:facilitated trehalose transporter Tret1-2 homolog n=1 Tax=Bacillus rossius redtenbacheri TaxID=93214 RepID=UPI002FDE7EFF